MANAPSPPWNLHCPWCCWNIWVYPRGMRGRDPGSGVCAANAGKYHAEQEHGKSWNDWLEAEENAT